MPVLETFLELPTPLVVGIDALGRDYTVRHQGQEIAVRFPSIHPSGKSSFLAAPNYLNVFADDGFSSTTLGENFYWGLESRENAGDLSTDTAAVFAVGLISSCESGDEQLAANALTLAMSQWWPQVRDWIEVLTGQVPTGPGSTGCQHLHPIWVDIDGTVKRRFRDRPLHEPVDRTHGLAPSTPADARVLEASLHRAAGPPPIEWLLIRDGRAAHHLGSRRRAVIDAGTATELAVTALIRRCESHLSEPAFEQLMSQHRMLGKRVAYFRRTGSLPPGTNKLVEARNHAAHQGTDPSVAESSEALLTAADIVEMAYPLASFV